MNDRVRRVQRLRSSGAAGPHQDRRPRDEEEQFDEQIREALLEQHRETWGWGDDDGD